MHALLAVALSLTLDVPYLPQTDQLCGGAAAAMVFRYLGDAHADVRSFAPIVDRRAGGIASGELTREIARRGWTAEPFTGSLAALRDRLQRGAATIVLLKDKRAAYHYVVVVGTTDSAIVVHDPSWGPSRSIADDAFERAWKPAGFWALAISGGSGVPKRERDVASEREASAERDDPCATLLTDAVARIARSGIESADAILEPVRAECPRSAGPLRELAGVRFAQKRWTEAAALARQALDRDSNDAYAIDVLGSALFMQNDEVGALEAWNRIGRPHVDRVRIDGITRSRHQTIAAALGLESGDLLTADAFARARRRLNELPGHSSARLSLRPQADGFALVDVAVAERSAIPRDTAAWAGVGVAAAVDRQIDVAVPGFTGQGEMWRASWRWWANRPMAAVAFEAPHVAGIANVWRVDASWDEQTYASRDAGAIVRESRAHGGLTVGDWIGGNWRYSASVGIDGWNQATCAASIGASLERRMFADRLSVAASATSWTAGFAAMDASAAWRSKDASRWTYAASASARRVSDTAPLGLWAGAGDGRARADLLRAHPLLDDGIIQTSAAFGRTLIAGSGETTRWFDKTSSVRLGVAVFADAAQARRSLTTTTSQVDMGAGVRLRIPGAGRTLRIDFAHGLRDGANAVTVGWTLPIADRGSRIADSGR
ncbi:MAG TPA: C39 family peptidase [Vicinamibacterales bacterium]|nr:C39 family peptidase [Vicinamibacterales bacterium]